MDAPREAKSKIRIAKTAWWSALSHFRSVAQQPEEDGRGECMGLFLGRFQIMPMYWAPCYGVLKLPLSWGLKTACMLPSQEQHLHNAVFWCLLAVILVRPCHQVCMGITGQG